MSVTTIFDFQNPADYTYDAGKVEFVGGKAQLKLTPIAQSFPQDFAASPGFVFDPNKTEFVGGMMRQKDQRPAGATFGATFTNGKDANWGNGILTGTLLGNTTIMGGKVDCSVNGHNGIWFDDVGNGSMAQTGCIKYRYTPAHSGNPPELFNVFSIGANTGLLQNRIAMLHRTGGTLCLYVNDSAGVEIHANVQIGTVWSPTGGQEYEFEFDFDCTTGIYRLFINGALHGQVLTGICTRVGGTGRKIVFGNDETFTYNFNGKFDDIELFDTVQHTAEYAMGYTIPEHIYAYDVITLPEMAYTGPGSMQQIVDFVTTEANAPHYTVQIQRSGVYVYWDGTAHVPSNGSFAQSNDLATANAHIGAISIAGAIYGQVRVHFANSDTQQSIDNLIANVIGQQYPSDNPTIETIATIRNDGFIGLAAVSTGAGVLKYILLKNNAPMYWNGTAWAISSGAYAESNTLAEIAAHAATFSTVSNDLKIRLFLHSDSAQQIAIDTLTVSYDFSAPDENLQTVIVWAFVNDVTGLDVATPITVKLNKKSVKYGDSIIIDGSQKNIAPVNGYIEITLPVTDQMESGSFYTFAVNGVKYNKLAPSTLSSSAIFALPDYMEA